MLVIGFFLMAGEAGIVFVTALEFDGDDVQLGMPMYTASLVIDWFAKDIDSADLGDFERFQYLFLSKGRS